MTDRIKAFAAFLIALVLAGSASAQTTKLLIHASSALWPTSFIRSTLVCGMLDYR